MEMKRATSLVLVSAMAAGLLAGCGTASTASTVAAGAFIGSSVVYSMEVASAAIDSTSASDFAKRGDWETVLVTAGGGVAGGIDAFFLTASQTPIDNNPSKSYESNNRVGLGSPNKNAVPNGSYTKVDNNGNLYSYTQFDSQGRQSLRIDYQGKAHNGVIPHIHVYKYS